MLHFYKPIKHSENMLKHSGTFIEKKKMMFVKTEITFIESIQVVFSAFEKKTYVP